MEHNSKYVFRNRSKYFELCPKKREENGFTINVVRILGKFCKNLLLIFVIFMLLILFISGHQVTRLVK